jgi:CspA family cold shock protein
MPKWIVTATVTAWHDDEGWGVARSDDVPGDICVLWGCVAMDGWAQLAPGERIRVNVEKGEQDGCPYRAVSARVI